MIDKHNYTSFIHQEDVREFIIKNVSKLEGVLDNFDIRRTGFMNPYEQKLFNSILNAFSNEISYRVIGGNENSERKMFIIYPNYIYEVELPIKLLRLYGNFKFEKISHRDCLGALMSVGITREKIGDIHIHKCFIDVVIDEAIGNYMISNITSIRHCSIKGKILPIEELTETEIELVKKEYSVSSLRLDNIIAEAFNLSRASAISVIKSERVKVNYEPIFSQSKEIEENSLISVKGYGRFVFISSNGFSKKGKIRISLAHYK